MTETGPPTPPLWHLRRGGSYSLDRCEKWIQVSARGLVRRAVAGAGGGSRASSAAFARSMIASDIATGSRQSRGAIHPKRAGSAIPLGEIGSCDIIRRTARRTSPSAGSDDVVDGGQNPRKSSDMKKIGTRFAAGHRRIIPSNSWRRTKAGGIPLSRPSAAGGGGRMPVFTRGYHRPNLGRRIHWCSPWCARGFSQSSNSTTDEFRWIYADSHRRQQTSVAGDARLPAREKRARFASASLKIGDSQGARIDSSFRPQARSDVKLSSKVLLGTASQGERSAR
jgi:hypothetical protein